MENLIVLQDLAIVMTASAVITVLFHRMRLPIVLGYILAGFLIGPHTPPYSFVHDLHSIHTLSELGVIFLLFAIGLEFSLTKLMKVGFAAVIAATMEIVLMIWIGYTAGQAFGWNFIDSLFLGAILSISSTTIIAKVLMENRMLKEKFAQVILGILIIEDLLAIVIIAILSGLAITGSLTFQTAGLAMLKVLAFVAGTLFAGYLFIPRLLRYLEKLQIPEMLIVSVLGICFAAALLATKMGFSVALGAFLTGAIIAETKQGQKVVHQVEPIKDMFSAVFFVSVGMLIDPRTLAAYWLPILVIAAITIIGKVISCSSGTFLAGYKSETALKVGLGLSQIGEFSFIIARLGESTNVTSHFLYPIAVSVSAITTLTTPVLMNNTVPIISGFKRIAPKRVTIFLSFYTSWIQSLKLRDKPLSQRKAVFVQALKEYLPILVFYMIAAVIFLFGAEYFKARLESIHDSAYWFAVALGLFPLFMGFVYTLERMIWKVLAANVFSGDGEKEYSAAFRNFIRFALVLAGAIVFVPIVSRFIPSRLLLALISCIAALFGFLLWGSMARMHERIEKTVLGVFEREELSKTTETQAHNELVELIREEYPWEVETMDYLVPFKESAVQQRIRDLRLRGETGASIVAIYRDEQAMPNPSPDTKIMPGDVLLLMGDKDQIKAASQYLNKKCREAPAVLVKREGGPKTFRIEMLADSPFAGQTVKQIHLRRKTGATILGIQKGETVINNPDAQVSVEAGDVLILFGWQDELQLAARYLSGQPAH